MCFPDSENQKIPVSFVAKLTTWHEGRSVLGRLGLENAVTGLGRNKRWNAGAHGTFQLPRLSKGALEKPRARNSSWFAGDPFWALKGSFVLLQDGMRVWEKGVPSFSQQCSASEAL